MNTPIPYQIADAINEAYQAGGDEKTLRDIANRIGWIYFDATDAYPRFDSQTFTDRIEMCGLILNP